MRLPKIIAIILAIVIVSLSFLPEITLAQEESASWAFPTDNDFATSVEESFNKDDGQPEQNSKINAESYMGPFAINVAVSYLRCALGGYPCVSSAELQPLFTNTSLINLSTNMIAGLYKNPPANTGIWLADVTSNFGLIPKTYAQGIGFSSLSGLLPLWKASRNIAYSLLIIVLLIIGLMIMFRSKIDPRTVISIQSALPRIIITLILITFSYPIAALMIDLLYLLMFFGIDQVASAVKLGKSVSEIQGEFAAGGGLGWIWGPIPTEFWLAEGVGALLLILAVPLKGGAVIAKMLGKLGTVGTLAGGSAKAASVLTGGTGILLLLVLIAFFFAILRIFFMLLTAYINIIIAIIFAPIWLLGQAVPGQNQFQFMPWIKNMLANIIVFPATAVLLLLANAVATVFKPGFGNAGVWTPPLLPAFGDEMMEIIIGLGFALLIPQLVMTIKKMFAAKPIMPVGSAFGRAIGQPIGIGQQVMATLGQFRLVFGTGHGGKTS